MMKLVILILIFVQTSFAITLDEYLAQVKKNNRIFTSIDLSVEASQEKRDAGDLLLTPQLSATYSLTSDKSLPNNVADERKIYEYTLGVSKKFSTGTLISLTGKTDKFENISPINGNLPQYSAGGIGVSLQQSLWKDFFGNATRLRHEREYAVNTVETMTLELKRRSLLIEAESSFWDYVVALEDLKLKQENLERAKKLDRWTSGRVNNGISDRSDLMNVKALMSLRELELQTALDELKTQEVRFRENLDLATSDPTPEVQANLFEPRPYVKEMMSKKNVILIESYLASLDAKSKMLISDELADSFKPDLSLIGSYNTSAFDVAASEPVDDISNTDRPKTFIGVNFNWLFDTSAKKSQLSSIRKDALVAQYTAEKKMEEGRIAWSEHLRKYQVTQETVKTLEQIANYQKERVKAEQDKFSKGRTITTNVVTAETDSAEADVKYLKAKSGLRKLEAATLLFTELQE